MFVAHHGNAISGEMDVDFDEAHTQSDGRTQCRKSVLGELCRVPSITH
jgi:hypothetical protein